MKLRMRLLWVLCWFSLLAACETNTPTTNPSTVPIDPSRAPVLTSTPAMTVTASETPVLTCSPTHDDELSPTYQPDTPVRSIVGHGHVLTGVVRSSDGCWPIANARLELWPEYANQGHPDAARATIFTDSTGTYRFECDPPEHIHMRISAPGYRTLAQNSYHPDGPQGIF